MALSRHAHGRPATACLACDLRPVAADLDPRTAIAARFRFRRAARLDAKTLVSFETRHLASNPAPSGRGIGAAREWILQELKSFSPKLQVSFDAYRVAPQGERILREIDLRNVMAVLPGRSPRRIYVGGHYDSIARLVNPPASAGPPGQAGIHWNLPDTPAPGANDDGSGTVLTMELARAFAQSGMEFDATLVFIAFAGEEEGLTGATCTPRKHRPRRRSSMPSSTTTSSAAQSAPTASRTPTRFGCSRMAPRTHRRGSSRGTSARRRRDTCQGSTSRSSPDMIAFGAAAITSRSTSAASRLSGSRKPTRTTHEQHTVDDTIDHVSFPYLARNARVNAAGVATLALAPPAPEVIYDTRPRRLSNAAVETVTRRGVVPRLPAAGVGGGLAGQ